MTLTEYRANNPHLVRPVCPRCKGPKLLVPDIDAAQEGNPGRYGLECPGTWAIRQSDEQFWAAWDNLPGDEVVRLEKELRSDRA